jgi:hypothetical protein
MKTLLRALTPLSGLLLMLGASESVDAVGVQPNTRTESPSDGGTLRQESAGDEGAGASEDQGSPPDANGSENPADEAADESEAADADISESGDESDGADSTGDSGEDDSEDDASDESEDE